MIYTASYFKPEFHHGAVIRTSIKVPPGIKVDGELEFFYPTPRMVYRWHQSAQTDEDWAIYTAAYWDEVKPKRDRILTWVESLDPAIDQTLCCYEPTDERCHRRYCGMVVQKYRPDCWGGESVLREIPPVIEVAKKPRKPKMAKGTGYWDVGAHVKHRIIDSVPGREGWIGTIVLILTPTIFDVDWGLTNDVDCPKSGHRDHYFRKGAHRYPKEVLQLVDQDGNPYGASV